MSGGWLTIVLLLLFFWWALRKQRRYEAGQKQVREQVRESDLLRQVWQDEQHLKELECQLDALKQQETRDLLQASLGASEDAQVDFLNLTYGDDVKEDKQ